jgi:hypothetical protein
MTAQAAEGDFCWRTFPEIGARVEHPLLRQPVSLIVDDPTPGYNPGYFHSGFRYGPLHTPRELVDRFADLLERTGMRGKFSIIPYPFGLGRVDRAVEGVSEADLTYFLDVVRERIAPFLDITPEALTHWNALDLATWQLLPLWEHLWSRRQDRHSLTPYMALGLEILNNCDLPTTGVTSPWDFGDGVEAEYAEAILAAQRRVNARTFTWYFLQMDGTSRHVPPRLTVFRPEAGEAVVSIVTCDTYDFGRGYWWGGEAELDMLISADGRQGRIAETLRAGSPAVFHTHWQTMFAQGSFRGLSALEEIAGRIEAHFGDRIAWTGCADLAAYTATAAALSLEREQHGFEGITVRTATPFTCPRFTISLGGIPSVREVLIDGRPLRRVATPAALIEDTYLVEGQRLYLSWKPAGRQELVVRR